MPLNGDMLAQEVLEAIGGRITPKRQEAFKKMCEAIVLHIQTNGIVNVVGVQNGSGTTVGTIT